MSEVDNNKHDDDQPEAGMSTGDGGVYGTAEVDTVRHAFNQGTFVGIRSLPNSITPSFRGTSAGKDKGGKLDGEGVAPPLHHPVAAGQVRPGKYSGAPKVFTLYEYQPSEYDREKELRARQWEESKAMRVDTADFKCTALPAIPKSAGSFNEFEYAEDPFENQELMEKAAKLEFDAQILHGPMRVAGQAQELEKGKARLWELLRKLTKQLKEDWPTCLLRVYEDDIGCVVATFDQDKIQGDVSTYMNQFFRTNEIVQYFGLRKDSTRWGAVEKDKGTHVHFVFIPTWVHLRAPVDMNLPAPKSERSQEPALISGRVPFGPQTNGGQAIQVHVRTYSRSFKY